jgi:hypothetical protein
MAQLVLSSFDACEPKYGEPSHWRSVGQLVAKYSQVKIQCGMVHQHTNTACVFLFQPMTQTGRAIAPQQMRDPY